MTTKETKGENGENMTEYQIIRRSAIFFEVAVKKNLNR
jgi:hypothetical protein